jgi:hypothetical protein
MFIEFPMWLARSGALLLILMKRLLGCFDFCEALYEGVQFIFLPEGKTTEKDSQSKD